jgi:GNAT superfamily N-acetyltransferase
MSEWRFFQEDDLDWIIKTTREMFEESEWKDGKYDEEKVKQYFYHVIDQPTLMFGAIGLKDEERAGFMTGQVGEFSFMKAKFARESDLFVLPKYRGSQVAITLMKKFIEWAKGMNAKEVYLQPATNGKLNKFDAMAKRLGMEIVSKTYRKKL